MKSSDALSQFQSFMSRITSAETPEEVERILDAAPDLEAIAHSLSATANEAIRDVQDPAVASALIAIFALMNLQAFVQGLKVDDLGFSPKAKAVDEERKRAMRVPRVPAKGPHRW